jgi:hypothetical protein
MREPADMVMVLMGNDEQVNLAASGVTNVLCDSVHQLLITSDILENAAINENMTGFAIRGDYPQQETIAEQLAVHSHSDG